MGNIEIRKATSNDLTYLPTFYEKAYGGRVRFKYPERWHWAFVDNPFKDNDHPSLYIATANNQLVGHSAAIEVPLWVNQQRHTLGWGVDSLVLSEYRGQGLGSKLQQCNKADHRYFASLAMTPANMHIKLAKLDAKQGPLSTLYVSNLTKVGQISALQKSTNSRWLGYAALAVGELLTLSVRIIKALKADQIECSSINVAQPERASFGMAEDRLWERARSRYQFAVERFSDYLNWRYRDQPWTEYWCIRAYSEKGELKGLLIFRYADESTPAVGVIVELYDADGHEATVNVLTEQAEKILKAMGVSQVQVAASDAVTSSVIRNRGYMPLEVRPLIINAPNSVMEMISTETPALLSKGDQDWDQYPRARFYDHAVIIRRLAVRFSGWIKRTGVSR